MSTLPDIRRCGENGTYHLRQAVPADLREFVGKKVIRRSLETQDEERARRRARDHAAEYESLFRRMRTGVENASDAGIFSYLLYCCRDRM